MHIVAHLVVCVVAGAVFLLLTRPAELSGERRWKTHISHILLIFAMLGLGARVADAGGLEAVALAGSLLSLLGLGFLWAPNLTFLASRGATSLLYGDGEGGGGFRTDFREARLRIREGEWNGAVKLIELELTKEPKDFEGLRLLAEACGQLKMFEKAQAQMETILNNPAATDDQKAWAKTEQARIGNCQSTAASRATRPGRFVSA